MRLFKNGYDLGKNQKWCELNLRILSKVCQIHAGI